MVVAASTLERMELLGPLIGCGVVACAKRAGLGGLGLGVAICRRSGSDLMVVIEVAVWPSTELGASD